MEPLIAYLHQRFALALILFSVVLGVWGTVAFARRRQIGPGFRSSFVLVIALTAIQGLAGLILLTMVPPRSLLHLVYGGFAILFLPGVYFYAGRGSRVREAALLSAACWIVAIAFGRGIITGR